MAISVPPEPPLPAPALSRIAYGAPAVPETWNDIIDQIEANFAFIGGQTVIIKDPTTLPQYPTQYHEDRPIIAFTYDTGQIYVFRHDGDAAADADGVHIVAAFGGKTWVRLSQPQSVFFDESEVDVLASGLTGADLGLSVAVAADGVTPIVITLGVGYTTGSATQPFVEILEDDLVVATRRLPLAADDNGFVEVNVPRTPSAGTRTYTARFSANEAGKTVESKGGTLGEHKRTITVKAG